ncbi:MAG: pilus assembly protein PilP [Pseudomonadales bacterium]
MQILKKPVSAGRAKVLLAAACAVLLGGCNVGGEHGDLRAFMDEVQSRPPGRIEPLPPFEQVPPFAYQAGNLRSPFEPPVLVKPVPGRPSGPQVKPDLARARQFLEDYPIGSLIMVGTLAQSGRVYGLIRDGNGGVHRVRHGDYMGTDHGRIQQIQDTSIELIEIVPDGTGTGWVERARTVSLGGGNKG